MYEAMKNDESAAKIARYPHVDSSINCLLNATRVMNSLHPHHRLLRQVTDCTVLDYRLRLQSLHQLKVCSSHQ